MGRFRDSSSEGDNEAAIDMSPLIDCVFILLIFFIVTTVFVEETGVEVDKPESGGASQLDKNSLLFAVMADGTVIHAKKNIGVSGVQAIVRRELQSEPEMPVIIQADESAPSGITVRVVGEAKLAQAKNVSLSALIPQG